MTIERRRPLPAGRYWIDVFEKDRAAWLAWRTAMVNMGRLKVTHTESFEPIGDNEAHDFIIFETDAETVGWPDQIQGPNIAGPKIQSSNDTADLPEPTPGIAEQLSSAVSGAASGVKTVAVVGIGIAVAIALVSLFRRR